MYGSKESDLVVKYYDVSFGISGEAEVAWYLTKVRDTGGSVLDLACGTGRLALQIAREGYEVTAIDQSEGMLNIFRKKLEKEPAEVQQRVFIEKQRMSDFRLERKFNTIICCDAFFHNLTVLDQINCLKHVSKHLTPKGRFVFNLPNPTCDFLLKGAASKGKEFEKRGRYKLEDGSGELLIEQAHAVQMDDQLITTTLRITKLDKEENIIEMGESNWVTRYLFRYEAIHLLYRCGFKIESLVGDYENGPVTEKSQLIFDVKLVE